ncbi:hypothetical protein Ddye_013000 [Dipteronia dyeriana]|uniref:Uncharacterized protein n=1 Tax=Dipteronia dyeriana TaxID=168575 RepID=A0AAD9X5G7_9ROSI|nr:hypothetical protein Ddye_013000 [Dipteronia dyeriana]
MERIRDIWSGSASSGVVRSLKGQEFHGDFGWYVSDTVNGVFVDSRMYPEISSPYPYNEGAFQLWDVGNDGFDSMNMENVEILKIANLTLDEPKLEAELFRSFNNVNDVNEVN